MWLSNEIYFCVSIPKTIWLELRFMTIHAVLYWDSSDKSISSMIFDEQKFTLSQFPNKQSFLNDDEFDEKIAEKYFNDFFNKIINLDHNKVKLTYKSVSPISPSSKWKQKTSDDSTFVDNAIRSNFNKIPDIKTHRARGKLTGKSLKLFEEALKNLGLITGKNDAFKHRLWALVVSATNRNVEEKALKKLFMINKQISRMSAEYRQQYQTMLDQIAVLHLQ